MSHRWLVLRLEAPLMAFGGVAIDQVGPPRQHPALSMLTGLMANALGWDWTDRAAHGTLQDRLLFGAATLREGETVTDTQNVRMRGDDRGWTTRGAPEGRTGASYDAPHRRRRDFLADAAVRVVLRLQPPDEAPTLDDLAEALDCPARPLFIGRKPCLPTAPVRATFLEADTVHDALLALDLEAGTRAAWPQGEGPPGDRTIDLPDRRNWDSGLHGGTRRVHEGRL